MPSAASPSPRERPVALVLVVALGGALGGCARWLVGQALPHPAADFPWATFVENVSGCLLIGVLMAVLVAGAETGRGWGASPYARPFWAVGVLGGYTTFSAFAAESVVLVREGAPVTAVVYVAASVAAGLLAVRMGLAGGAALHARWERR